ncbi:YbhB/YbcL family Raf kinase inhibitor-like protein [Noviherbaspirillum aridicola]|uniref:Phosphatidylethanolamine-binding protein n=1 Tax=Noviherbaspirillum aridicola TaxID=2849687 RepID=A0ABQ4PZ20_9BURK|nr:YbhB/YbcL family Raf kinase inhibitor-like protein [Noviherbaspirillum aridicola]GIZ50133.1 phosphatidylethanolamine-binding protein [Noviherbaspirillum aridicola]
MLEKLPSVIGHALQHRRAGLEKIAFNQIDLRAGTAALQVTSLSFGDHEPIPARFTADGEGSSPPLEWTGVPEGTATLALIVEDADAPTPQPLVHAIAVDLPAHDGVLHEGELDSDELDGQVGRNSYLRTGWLPPDPPPGHGVHRYAFQLFALESGPAFSGTPGREALLEAIQERAIASGCLIGTYERPDGSIRLGAKDAVRASVSRTESI